MLVVRVWLLLPTLPTMQARAKEVLFSSLTATCQPTQLRKYSVPKKQAESEHTKIIAF